MTYDETCYINLKDGTIEDSAEGYLHCDKLIAPTILELNNKGYKTTASCSGHSTKLHASNPIEIQIDNNDGMSVEEQIEKALLYCYQQGMIVMVNRVDKNTIYLDALSTGTYIYVSFQKIYDFPNLPKEFMKSDDSQNRTSIGKWIERRRSDNTYKTNKEFYQEIVLANQELLEWAKSLDYNIEKNI